jgi:hypothetical protein
VESSFRSDATGLLIHNRVFVDTGTSRASQIASFNSIIVVWLEKCLRKRGADGSYSPSQLADEKASKGGYNSNTRESTGVDTILVDLEDLTPKEAGRADRGPTSLDAPTSVSTS